jgi:hypothetical protein
MPLAGTMERMGRAALPGPLRTPLVGPSRLRSPARESVVQLVGRNLDDILIHRDAVLPDELGFTVGQRRGGT